MMWDGNGYWGHGAGWEGWLMLVFMIVLVAAAVIAVVYLVRFLGQPQGAPVQAAQALPAQTSQPRFPQAESAAAVESPKEIVKRRYAAGEIDREEYLQKLGDL